MNAHWESKVRQRLQRLYGPQGEPCFAELRPLLDRFLDRSPAKDLPAGASRWSERDVVLITYGDQLTSTDATPLGTLARFLEEHGLQRVFSTIHLLPFCPATSDDGFSIVDYHRVDPALGCWDDIERLGQDCGLMFDIVLNHTSQSCEWFQRYLSGDPAYAESYLCVDPAIDLSQVVRPRNHALLTPFSSATGERHVWTTFSDDQVDLNYADPQVLLRMVDVMLDYVAHGATVLRLDAVAFLWKQIGTPSIHLPQTHEVVKLFRDVLDAVAPHDGVGVRPLEDLVPTERRDRLIEAVRQRGGEVSQRRQSDGTTVPYELNISYVDAVAGGPGESAASQAARFLCTQTLMLALKGIPAVYFHSLVGTQNDLAGMADSGIARRINRRKFTTEELAAALAPPDSLAARIFSGLRQRIETRIRQPAFHPDGAQVVEQDLPPPLLALQRTSPDGKQRLHVVANLGPEPAEYRWSGTALEDVRDLLAPSARFSAGTVPLEPYQVAWLQAPAEPDRRNTAAATPTS